MIQDYINLVQILGQSNNSSYLSSKRVFSQLYISSNPVMENSQTWKIKLILVCYFCNILNLQGRGLNLPFLLHRHFIRLLWICFPVEQKSFSKCSYFPLLITTTTIYIINERFSQKMFYSNHHTVTWRCQFESLLVKNVCSGISMA